MAKKGVALATMRAVRIHAYGGPEVLVAEDAPRPEPGAKEVLIRVQAAGINPWDWKVRTGYVKDIIRFQLPMIPGWDVSGIIAAAGAETTAFKPGDEVYGLLDRSRDGSYAEYAVAQAAELALKPKSLDFVQAAAMPMTSLAAWQALFEQAGLSAGQTILIHGAAGGIGHLAVQFAKWKGAYVIGTAATKDLDFVLRLGADEVIDFQTEQFEDKVRDVDVVLDVIAGEVQERSWPVIRKGGILVSTLSISSMETATKFGVQAKAFTAHSDGPQLAQIAELVDAGKVKPFVNTVLPLEAAGQAHDLLQHGHMRGKVVLKVAG